MTTKNCANVPKLVLKDFCAKCPVFLDMYIYVVMKVRLVGLEGLETKQSF